MYSYEAFLGGVEEGVRASYHRQILDKNREEDGAFISPDWGMASACHASNASYLCRACLAYMADGSSLEGDKDLLERVMRSIAFQRRWQRETGLVDLPLVNLHSAPDTGFTINFLSPTIEIARGLASGGNAGAAQIAEALGEYVRTAATGMIERGFHTPNHRWVVVSALAQAMKLFPEIDATAYAERILAETIDMNEDGEYSERSNGAYNAVCNQSLIHIADYMDKPEMLDLVRRNLNMMVKMFYPNGTIYTSVSGRQDRAGTIIPGGGDVFFVMAQRDRNGVWATVADMLGDEVISKKGGGGEVIEFLLHPEYRDDTVEREPIPTHFDAYLPSSKIWRIQRGQLTATAAAGISSPFELKYGDAHLKGVKINANWFHIGLFKPTTMEQIENGVRMTYVTKSHGRPAYDMPLGRAVAFDGWSGTFHERNFWELEPFLMTLDITEVDGGFDLHFRTEGGLDRVMFDIECYFGTPGEWETDTEVMPVSGQAVIMKSGYGVFRSGSYGIKVGPGIAEHRMWGMRGWDGGGGVFKVRLLPLSPVDHTLEIRYGMWSMTEDALVLDE